MRARRVSAALALALLLATPLADAVVYGASTTSETSANSATRSVARPTGTGAGQLLLAQVVADGGTGTTITPPSGWTLVKRTDSTTELAVAIYTRWATASEPATYTWSFSPSGRSAIGLARYLDVDATTPLDVAVASATADAATLTAPSVTTATPNALLVVMAASKRATTFAPASGMTERYDVAAGVTAEASDQAIAAAGTTGTRAVVAANKDRGIVHALVLRTAPAKVVSMNATALNALESVGTARFGVQLNVAASAPVQVDYVVGGTATGGGVDYTLASGTLTFLAGQTFKGINASVVSDVVVEPDETIVVTLSNARNATIGAAAATTFTIRNDDATVFLANQTLSIAEAAGSARLFVSLAAPSALPVSVSYATSGGTALSGSDYAVALGTLAFAPGETSKSFDVAIVNDALREATETVTVQVHSPLNASLGPASATVSILDDEPIPTVGFAAASASGPESVTAPAFSVALSGATFEEARVAYAVTLGSAGSADATAATGVLVFPPGATTREVALSVANDLLDETDETLSVALSAPVNAILGAAQLNYTILDDDATPSVAFTTSASTAPETGAATVAVALSAPSGLPVLVDVARAGGSANATDSAFSPTTLVVPPGAAGASFTFALVDDAITESDETLELVLASPRNATLGAPAAQTITILDDEAPISVRFAQADESVAETAGSLALRVTLSGIAAFPVLVNYSVAGGSAGAADYALAAGTLAFAPGATSATILLAIADDEAPEGAETIVVALSDAVNATLAGQSATITIADDDPPFPIAQFALAGSDASETGGEALVLVTLSAPSTRAVTVAYDVVGGTATGGGADYVLAPGALTFAPGETARAIALQLVDDVAVEGVETIVLGLRAPARATLGALSTHTVSVASDDLPPVAARFQLASSAASEAARAATLAVELSRASSQPVSIAYSVADQSARGGGIDYQLASGVLVFAPGETARAIAVEITDDGDIEPDETLVVTLTGGAVLGAPSTHVLTIVSDDTAALTVQFAAPSGSASEGAGVATVVLALSGSSGDDLDVGIVVAGGSATAGVDYATPPARVAFPAGTTIASFALQIAQDAAYEGDETILLALADPSGGVIGATPTFSFTILEDDAAPQRVLAVAPAPLRLDGSADSASWGNWSAEAGQALVASTNYLKITNVGGVPNPSVVVSFSPFVGGVDAAAAIPVAGNIQFAWWEDTTPGASAPGEGTYAFGAASAGASTTIAFTGTSNIVYVAYRIVAIPDPLPPQSYQAAFTVTEL